MIPPPVVGSPGTSLQSGAGMAQSWILQEAPFALPINSMLIAATLAASAVGPWPVIVDANGESTPDPQGILIPSFFGSRDPAPLDAGADAAVSTTAIIAGAEALKNR